MYSIQIITPSDYIWAVFSHPKNTDNIQLPLIILQT